MAVEQAAINGRMLHSQGLAALHSLTALVSPCSGGGLLCARAAGLLVKVLIRNCPARCARALSSRFGHRLGPRARRVAVDCQLHTSAFHPHVPICCSSCHAKSYRLASAPHGLGQFAVACNAATRRGRHRPTSRVPCTFVRTAWFQRHTTPHVPDKPRSLAVNVLCTLARAALCGALATSPALRMRAK